MDTERIRFVRATIRDIAQEMRDAETIGNWDLYRELRREREQWVKILRDRTS